MHLGLASLFGFYARHHGDEALVLVTVIATEGSTYRKPGALMLIARDGDYQGMVSGGCLEQDLALRAERVFASGRPERVCYDLRGDDQQLIGLGLGCDGVVHLLLQRLDRDRGFGFLPFLEQSLQRRSPCLLALVTGPGHPAVALGAFSVFDDAGESCHDDARLDSALRELGEVRQDTRAVPRRLDVGGHELQLLTIRILPTPRVLVCGAGPDAEPLARQIDGLGWECCIIDHRPAFADAGRFPAAARLELARPSEMSERVELAELSAAVVMSHNLEHDTEYLGQLLAAGIPYVGLLGPRARRERLLKRLGKPGAPVRGPAGLDIGAELPESIALAIMAEIHAVLNGCRGTALAADAG